MSPVGNEGSSASEVNGILEGQLRGMQSPSEKRTRCKDILYSSYALSNAAEVQRVQSRSDDVFLTPADGLTELDRGEGGSEGKDCEDCTRLAVTPIISRTTSNKKMRTESGSISTKMSQLQNVE